MKDFTYFTMKDYFYVYNEGFYILYIEGFFILYNEGLKCIDRQMDEGMRYNFSTQVL